LLCGFSVVGYYGDLEALKQRRKTRTNAVQSSGVFDLACDFGPKCGNHRGRVRYRLRLLGHAVGLLS
jgi:hypothetical protein